MNFSLGSISLPTPFRRIKWQAVSISVLGSAVTGLSPIGRIQIAAIFAFFLATLLTRWLILYKRWISAGAPERRRHDFAHLIDVIQDDIRSIRDAIHALAQSTQTILGNAQMDIRDLRKRVKVVEDKK